MEADHSTGTSHDQHSSNGKPRRRGPIRFVVLFVVLGALLLGAVTISPWFDMGEAGPSASALTYQVSKNPLQVTVTAEGNVESASNVEVKCRVAGGSTILWIVEDGKVVEAGAEIIRLDTSTLEEQLNSQRIAYENALAAQIQANETVEVSKISLKEYEEGTYVQALQQAEADIRIALENLRSAENQLKYSKRMVRKGFVSALQREADEFAVERAKLDLAAANTSKKVLVEFTRAKTIADLDSQRQAAEAQLRAQDAALQLEKVRLERLQGQLKNCVVTAPKRGMVVYANDARRSRYGGSDGPQIEEGAMVRERQALVRLPDLSQMQVKVTVHESRIDQITTGMPARIVIQDKEYVGRVLNVANQPEPGSWFSVNVKEYATTVSIEGEAGEIRPGMTAKVTILIDDLSDALSVPVSTVVEQRGEFFAWVRTPDGPEQRTMRLGQTNDKFIEVLEGVKEGEEVFRNPRAVVAEARQEDPFEKQAEDVEFAASGGESTSKGPPSKPFAPKAPAPSAAGTASGPPAAAGGSRGEGRSAGGGGRGGRGSFDLMQFDKNGDKKVTRDEAPEWMSGRFDRMDLDGNGFVDSADIAKMRKRRGRRGGGDGEGKRRRSREGLGGEPGNVP